MRTFIGAKLLSSKVAQPTAKPFEIYDSRLSGFTLRMSCVTSSRSPACSPVP